MTRTAEKKIKFVPAFHKKYNPRIIRTHIQITYYLIFLDVCQHELNIRNVDTSHPGSHKPTWKKYLEGERNF